MVEKVMIRVTADQRERLHDLKSVGDDYSDVVDRLLGTEESDDTDQEIEAAS